jgi:hypothetical protein
MPRVCLPGLLAFLVVATLASDVAGIVEPALPKTAAAGAVVFVEAESFVAKGGWVVDQQYMDQMGSPVLLAHGIGKPVTDATTGVIFPKPGVYRVFVRSRNWVAKWTPQCTPGIFHLLVDGKPLADTSGKPVEFGDTSAAWHWQDGGNVSIESGRERVTLALHDLTGFDGRCDAILFASADSVGTAYTPPEGDALTAFRRKALGLPACLADAPDAPEGTFDLIVTGGGYSGLCSAIAAARLGLKVALIQDRPVLGGNNSSEIRVHLRGRINYPPYENIGNLVGQLDPLQTGIAQPASQYGDGKKLALVLAEKNITLYLSTRLVAVEMSAGSAPSGYTRPAIKAVLTKNIETGRELRFRGRQFADCTGDGTLGFLAGAETRMGREARAQTGESLAPEKPDVLTMGASTPWNTTERFDADGKPVSTTFPELSWALQFNSETGHPEIRGDWNWESGLEKDQIGDVEEIRDNLFRAVYGHWSWMKNHTPAGWEKKVAHRELTWVPFIMGKRESRRIMGDVILRQQDIIVQKTFDDGCVIATWDIDLHYPTALHKKYFPDAEFKSVSDRRVIAPYLIPYRCFYSKDVPNLFMAGRDISVTHVALGSVRVMRTCGMMGEVVGMAASVCKKHDATPREVYEKHLSELKELFKAGVAPKPAKYQKTARPLPIPPIPAPDWMAFATQNLATNAQVRATPDSLDTLYRVNDGTFDYLDNRRIWIGAKSAAPQDISFAYFEPMTINALRVVSGLPPGVSPLLDFVLQYKTDDTGEWRDIPATKVTANTRVDAGFTFPRVTSRAFRLLITKAPGDTPSIWDIQFYLLDSVSVPTAAKKAYDFSGKGPRRALPSTATPPSCSTMPATAASTTSPCAAGCNSKLCHRRNRSLTRSRSLYSLSFSFVRNGRGERER